MRAAKLVLATVGGLLLAGASPLPSDFVLVAKTLESLASSSDGQSHPAIPSALKVTKNGLERSSLANLAQYARECPLRRIGTLTMGTPAAGLMVLEVRWTCPGRETENEAYFQISDGKLKSVSFGPLPIIRR